jgi:hypothetical protein
MVVISKIVLWHYDRNLIDGSTDLDQYKKLDEESLELYDSLCRGESPIDDIGDMCVVLINIAERNGLSLEECLEHAYADIKDRTGQMIDGIFVKDA